MRVCFVAGTLGRGGAERQLIFMLRALLLEQLHPRVVCLTEGEPFESEIRDLGVDVQYIGRSENRLSRLKELVLNLRRRPADLLQSVHFYTNIYVAAAGRLLNTPSIGAIRNDLSSEVASNGVWGKWQLSLPDSQIANTRLAVERAIAAGYARDRIFLVRNATEATPNPSRARNGTRTRLLFAGRLVEQKRPSVFIELAHRLRRSLPNCDLEFMVAGDGPLKPLLQDLAVQYEFQDLQLRFLGEQNSMDQVYRNADILILTSAFEGTPNVVLEAMAHGLPVVATRVGGVPEIVPQGCGVLVDPDDFEGLVTAVSTVVLDKEIREQMGRQALDFVKRDHSTCHLQKTLIDVYSKLLTEKRTGYER